MPWTFAHPAAVLPLRRFCPGRLNFAALVAGSTTPDLGYYLRLPDLAPLAHSAPGSVLACLPAGLALLAVLCALRKPLWFALPQPHRGALAPLALAPLSFRPGALLIAGASVWLGACTHIAWDSFTHQDAWLVSQLSPLREPWRLGGAGFPLYYLLQQFSTVAGALVLAVAYGRWLRRRASPATADARHGDRRRYALLAGLAAAALAVAVPLALEAAADARGFYAFRVFMFNLAIYGPAAFAPLFALASAWLYAARRRGA